MSKSVEEQVEDIEKKYEEMFEFIDYLFGQNGVDSNDLYELRRDIKELKQNGGDVNGEK